MSSGLGKPLFETLLATFARETGAGCGRHVIPALDSAGRHGSKSLAVPDGITPVFLPPCSPELQPVERLWPLVDGPVASKRFTSLADLDAAAIRPHTDVHRRPKPVQPN